MGGDLRALERGVDVAIGTPGRLVDLLRRERLPLGAFEGRWSSTRRTRCSTSGFARTSRRCSRRRPSSGRRCCCRRRCRRRSGRWRGGSSGTRCAIDPRKATGGAAPARAHGDIAYVAHLVRRRRSAGGGRQRAARRRTASAPSSSARRARGSAGCTRRWWRAASRRPRSRASARRPSATARSMQLRRGDMRVLVATNVAARGLHLPDVDLIIHADLPLNAESLTHRSGRTGRAGRKGTAVVIATAAERRKAERLLDERPRHAGLDAAPVARDDRRGGARASGGRAPGAADADARAGDAADVRGRRAGAPVGGDRLAGRRR